MPGTLTLQEMPCTALKGVGNHLLKLLAKRGINTVQDLLFHLPFHYQDRTRLTPLADLKIGAKVLIEGEIQSTHFQRGGRNRVSLICNLSDGTGSIKLRFFHFNSAQRKSFESGARLRCFGEVRGSQSVLEMIHPEYQQVSGKSFTTAEDSLTPIYPTTEGLSQQRLRGLMNQALELLADKQKIKDYLSVEIINQYKLPNLHSALYYLHRPPVDADVALLESGQHPSQQRLAFEELMAHQLSLLRLRRKIQTHRAPLFKEHGHLQAALLKQLPFELTGAQQRVSSEISSDLQLTYPMQRLVQGDVGSGKTIVAALAVLQAVDSGYQAAVMAPTELLAGQHWQNFKIWLEPLNIEIAWLTGKIKGKAREKTLAQIKTGSARVVIGTHALFQAEIEFAELGLMVVDEQHRFGVHQRLALREKAAAADYFPHQLIMTATPIPRTLAMTAYADLDCSTIDELPPGRKPVETVVLENTERDRLVERVRKACGEQKQVYWVCTLIEESEVLQCEAAEATAENLQQSLPELKIALIHGRLKSAEKEAIMHAFKAGELDLLVATTVIEVGVDVPNASVMIIENPERLGLAQLHQLRGRVGRGHQQSYCLLLYKTPLSESARKRLMILRDSNDGFEIARQDLALRGPGEVLGTKQTGLVDLKIADLVRDKKLLKDVQQAALLFIEQSNEKDTENLIHRWLDRGEEYAKV